MFFDLGSVRDIVDNDGDLRRHNVYDSFGRLTDVDYYDGDQDPVAANSANAIDELFGYTGRPLDEYTVSVPETIPYQPVPKP